MYSSKVYLRIQQDDVLELILMNRVNVEKIDPSRIQASNDRFSYTFQEEPFTDTDI